MKRRPNFLIIMCDQFRGDALGIEGHPVLQTPNLDALATGGIRFRHAYSPCPVSIPARRSFMSGQFPATHGMLSNKEGCCWYPAATLPGELKKAGYQTQLVGRDMHLHPRRKRYGFDEMLHTGDVHPDDLYAGRLPGYSYNPSWSHGLNANGRTARPWHLEEALHPSCRTVDAALRFLERRDPECPFLLVASFAGPHPPLYPPEFYMTRYLRAGSHPPHIGSWAHRPENNGAGLPVDSAVTCLEGDVLANCQAGYYGMINHIDDQICRLLSPQSGLDRETAADTIIIFCADHGEMLGDHYMFRKGRPYEGAVRVPLMIHAPDKFGFTAGTAVSAAVSLEDIMPTVLELAGVEIPASVEGRSLVPSLHGESVAREFIHAEHANDEGLTWHLLTDGQMKYIWHSGTGIEQLFNLDADPYELTDLVEAPERAEILAAWRQRLIKKLAGRPEGFVADGRLIAGRPHNTTMAHVSYNPDEACEPA
ncbi:MAG: sulfatase-like hydrolase/transferase [Kiritimatiellales bacterium]